MVSEDEVDIYMLLLMVDIIAISSIEAPAYDHINVLVLYVHILRMSLFPALIH